jgi:hypothetical protein
VEKEKGWRFASLFVCFMLTGAHQAAFMEDAVQAD